MLDCARQVWLCVLLDTLDDMESARALACRPGALRKSPYYQSPIAGAHYLQSGDRLVTVFEVKRNEATCPKVFQCAPWR